jgi:hypothetical protein
MEKHFPVKIVKLEQNTAPPTPSPASPAPSSNNSGDVETAWSQRGGKILLQTFQHDDEEFALMSRSSRRRLSAFWNQRPFLRTNIQSRARDRLRQPLSDHLIGGQSFRREVRLPRLPQSFPNGRRRQPAGIANVPARGLAA